MENVQLRKYKESRGPFHKSLFGDIDPATLDFKCIALPETLIGKKSPISNYPQTINKRKEEDELQGEAAKKLKVEPASLRKKLTKAEKDEGSWRILWIFWPAKELFGGRY